MVVRDENLLGRFANRFARAYARRNLIEPTLKQWIAISCELMDEDFKERQDAFIRAGAGGNEVAICELGHPEYWRYHNKVFDKAKLPRNCWTPLLLMETASDGRWRAFWQDLCLAADEAEDAPIRKLILPMTKQGFWSFLRRPLDTILFAEVAAETLLECATDRNNFFLPPFDLPPGGALQL